MGSMSFAVRLSRVPKDPKRAENEGDPEQQASTGAVWELPSQPTRSFVWGARRSSSCQLQKQFDNRDDAGAVCEELRNLCPRNANVINIELAQDEAHVGVASAKSRISFILLALRG
jgi:hypothetical protein